MSNTKIEKTGIKVTPGNADDASIVRPVATAPFLNVEDDEVYYKAHPPATGFPTLRFFDGSIGYQSPANPENYQLVAVQKKEDDQSSCRIS